MKKCSSFTALILILSMLLSLLPVHVAAEEALPEEKPATKAVSVSSISVPAYSGGTASTWMVYDGGGSVSFHDGSSDSKMQIIKGTTATQFNTYCTKLTSNGYKKLWSRTLAAQSGSNRYAKFLSPDGTYSVYTYFVPYTSQTRIIVDTHKDTVEGFSYNGKGSGTTEVYMYGLTYPDNGYAYTSTELGIQRRFPNGSMFVIKMPDNSLFVIDGGNKLQMSERAMADLYAFCREITGLPEGQKMVISAWHISHAHTDHVHGFSRFLTKYSHGFELMNIIYNTDYVEAGSTTEQALTQVGQLFPNARYYKPHTGERFAIAGVTFDVLYTAEDWYKPNSSNKLIQRDSACLTYSNDNNTSMALRMCFDGKSALWLGDLEKADAVLMGMYPTEDIQCDILQLPHHLLDDHTTLVKTVTPTIAFANQSKQGAYTRGKVFNYIIKIDSLTDIYYAGNQTVGYRADQGIFYKKDHVEFEYGNWGLRTYDIRDENAFTSEPIKAAEQYYRYTRVKDLKEGLNAYAIVDHTTDWVMSFDAINGGASRAMPAHYLSDTFYFADSQRRLVNWQIQYSQYGTNDNSIIPNYGNYFGTVTINKGSGDYWGTPKKNTGMYFGYNDTFQSAGMYSSWSAFSNQLEASSKGVWIDQTAGSTFLIYRYDNGTYYPLYRDGDVLADNGWGVAKLTTHSQARSKCHYLKTRLYLYNATPSDMNLTVTGHSDYYVYTGVPSNEIISHVVSDLRVNYTLLAFGATGEIGYDASLTKEAGTYRLEFTKTLAPNTVGDYPAVIRYINPNGTMQELGRITVHVEARDPVEDGELFFDFNDAPADRLRYRLEPQYNYFNFDSDKRWTASVYDNDNKKYTASSYAVDTEQGTMEIVMEDKTVTRKTVLLDLFAGTQFPLNYDPRYAEVLQLRLKVENMKAYSGKNPFLRLWYYGSDQVRHFDVAHYFGADYVSDGEYITLTLDLFDQAQVEANASVSGAPTMPFCEMDVITGLRLGFYYFLVNDTSQNGNITIDYIYVGPKTCISGHTPVIDAAVAATCTTAGKTEGSHCSVCNEVLVAQKTVAALGHDYSYTGNGDGTHTGICSRCNDRFAENHTFTNGLCFCGDKEITVDESIQIYHTLDLASDISITFAVPVSALSAYDSYYLECVLPEYENNAQIGTSTVQIQPVANGNYYYFTLTGITAVRMGDMVEAVLHMTKGTQAYISETDSYSVASYAYAMLNSTSDTKMLALCADLLRYGAEAQSYKKYRTDALVDAAMTATHRSYLGDTNALRFTATDSFLGDLDAPMLTWVGKTLDLGSKVGMKFVFSTANYSGDIANLSMKVTYQGSNGETKIVTLTGAEAYSAANSYYSFTFYGLLASELRAVVDVAIFEGDTQLSETLRYSAESYASKTGGTALDPLTRALFAYSDSAKVFFTQ